MIRQLFRATVLVAFTANALPPPARADEPLPARRVAHLHAVGDFIDDPFALSPDGSRLAWITTDGATRAQVHIAPVSDTKSEKAFPYGSITPERVEFLDADRVIVIERNPTTRFARAEVFGPKGSLANFGPATDVGLGAVSGVPAIVTWLKATSPKGAGHTFQAWRRDNLKPLAKKVLTENPDGRVAFAGSVYKPLYFLDGFSMLVGQKDGAFDKAKDVRRPDMAARADLFSGKLIAEKEIKDVVAYATLTNLRAKHNNEQSFLKFTDDRTALELMDPTDELTPLTMPRPLRKYEPDTLIYRPTPDANLIVSLTIDPVNAEAVKAQKADKDWLDVYHLDVKSRALTQLARIDGEKRPSTWFFSAGRLGLLRKHKGFGRGGEDLDVFDIGPEKPAPAPARPEAAAPTPGAAPSPPAPTKPAEPSKKPAAAAGAGATAR